VWAEGAVVATVRLYPRADWSELIEIYKQTLPKPRRVVMTGLGASAVLYVLPSGPGNYEEDMVFTTSQGVVTLRSPVRAYRAPPGAPPHRMLVLARGIRAELAR
jgi:hypothetical protein